MGMANHLSLLDRGTSVVGDHINLGTWLPDDNGRLGERKACDRDLLNGFPSLFIRLVGRWPLSSDGVFVDNLELFNDSKPVFFLPGFPYLLYVKLSLRKSGVSGSVAKEIVNSPGMVLDPKVSGGPRG